MKHIRRTQFGENISLDVTFSGEIGWNTHRMSCSELAIQSGTPFHKPDTVRINPTSFNGGNADQLRVYALELLRLADIAEDLQEEMHKMYEAKWAAEFTT